MSSGLPFVVQRGGRCPPGRQHVNSAHPNSHSRASTVRYGYAQDQTTRPLLTARKADPSQPDIIDETLDLFRANSLFRNFEIKGGADRTLIVLILFVSDCLAKLGTQRTTPTQIEASKLLNTLSVDTFPIPGDANFALNAHYAPPGSRIDAGMCRTPCLDCVPIS